MRTVLFPGLFNTIGEAQKNDGSEQFPTSSCLPFCAKSTIAAVNKTNADASVSIFFIEYINDRNPASLNRQLIIYRDPYCQRDYYRFPDKNKIGNRPSSDSLYQRNTGSQPLNRCHKTHYSAALRLDR